MGHSREVFHSGGNVSSKDTAKMKLLGFVLLLTFLVSTLGAPLVREELEETQWQAQDGLVLDESLKDMSENGIKDLESNDLEIEDNGIADLWNKFKKAVKDYAGGRAAELKKLVTKYKPRIQKELAKIKKELVSEVKKIAVDFLTDIIKIIIDTEDGLQYVVEIPLTSLADEPDFELMEVNSKISEWFKKVWLKIKAFFDKMGVDIVIFFDTLGLKIKEFFENLFPAEFRAKFVAALKKFWEKVKTTLNAVLKKYEVMIIEALKKDGKAILEEAEKLAASVVEGLAKVIIDAIKKLVGPVDLLNDDVDISDNGIKEFWEKVKAAVKEYFVSRGHEFEKMGPKYKSTVEDLLNKFETMSIKALKNMGVDFLGDLIKIIMGQDPTAFESLFNDEEFELSAVDSKIGDWFKKVWAKVKAFFDKLGHQIKEFFDNLGKQIKEAWDKLFPAELRAKIVAALKAFWKKIVAKFEETFDKYKDLIIAALKKDGKVILEEAEKLLQSVIEGVTKVIIDAIKKLIGDGIVFNDDMEDSHLDSIADCVKAEKECVSAATGLQKIKCLVDLATCVGGETAKCAQKCGPPLVTCVKESIFGGKIADVPKCFQTFVKCAADCAQSGELDCS